MSFSDYQKKVGTTAALVTLGALSSPLSRDEKKGALLAIIGIATALLLNEKGQETDKVEKTEVKSETVVAGGVRVTRTTTTTTEELEIPSDVFRSAVKGGGGKIPSGSDYLTLTSS